MSLFKVRFIYRAACSARLVCRVACSARLTELRLDGGELALQNPYKKVAATACWLQKSRINALGFAFDKVKHRLDHPRGREDLAVVGDALFGLDQTHRLIHLRSRILMAMTGFRWFQQTYCPKTKISAIVPNDLQARRRPAGRRSRSMLRTGPSQSMLSLPPDDFMERHQGLGLVQAPLAGSLQHASPCAGTDQAPSAAISASLSGGPHEPSA